MEELQTTLPKCSCCRLSPQILFKVTGPKIKDNNYIIDFIEEICCIKDNGWYMHLLETTEGICRQCFTKLKNFQSFKNVEDQYRFIWKKVALERDIVDVSWVNITCTTIKWYDRKKEENCFFLQRNATSLMTTCSVADTKTVRSLVFLVSWHLKC